MRRITYSKNIFLPVTDLCRNRCAYCSFRREPESASILSRNRAIRLMEMGAEHGCSEALFTMGEAAWSASGSERILSRAGVADLLGYLVELSELAIEHGLLPHTNAGLLDEDELKMLRPFNASMGLMLETTANVAAHVNSPGKDPESRLSYMRLAGTLRVPFTTGILIGIGESWSDRIDSLLSIADLHEEFGHIQEVIIQPLDPKPGTQMSDASAPGISDLCMTVKAARRILPVDVAIQVPPNLVEPRPLLACGASDLGGISPVTADGINPERPWPGLEELRGRLSQYELVERLAVYPRFIEMGWCGEKTRGLVASLAGDDGLRT